MIKLWPDFSHPTSLWFSGEISKKQTDVFAKPEDIDMPPELAERIYQWTKEFKYHFIDYIDDFNSRPIWNAGFNQFNWLLRGEAILKDLQAAYPEEQVVGNSKGYVYAPSEFYRGQLKHEMNRSQPADPTADA